MTFLTLFLITLQIAAFPGAQGYASSTPGGRGGDVLIVDRLEDDRQPGSLRWAVEQTGARTIVFEVAGLIVLNEPLRIGGVRQSPPPGDNPHSFLTIAGESAPGGGITLTNYPIEFNNDVHDIVVRHLRIRVSRVNPQNGSIGDGLAFMGAHHIMVDHVSLSWFADEGISIESTNDRLNHDITVQHSFVSEGLLNGGHPSGGPHSRCAITSDGSFNISLHHNVFMSCNRRNPNISGNSDIGVSPDPRSDIRYNLVYNPGEKAIQFARGPRSNVVGNLIRFGPGTTATHAMVSDDRQDEDTRIYLADNCLLTVGAAGEQLECPTDQPSLVLPLHASGLVTWELNPFDVPAVSPVFGSAQEILDMAGAQPADQADQLFRAQYQAYTGNLGAGNQSQDDINVVPPESGTAPADRDRDGLPDVWEAQQGLDPDDPLDSLSGTPYSWLERYLHERSGTPPIDTHSDRTPDRLSRDAFTAYPNPAYSHIVVGGATVDIVDSMGRIVMRGSGTIDVRTLASGLYVAVNRSSRAYSVFMIVR